MSDGEEKGGYSAQSLARFYKGEPQVIDAWASPSATLFQEEDARLQERLDAIAGLKDRLARSKAQLRSELQVWRDHSPEAAVTRLEFAQFALRLVDM